MDIQPQSTPERIESSITNVTDSRGETVPHNTTTEDTVLTLSGRGTASSIVFIFDSGVLLTTASVIAPDGTWRFTETVELGLHVFTVRDSLGGVDSPEWVVTVGEAELELREPAVTQAPDGILNPMDAINGATVVVTYAMRTTDTIGISWNGQDNLVATQPGSTLGSVTFTIPASAVAPVIGKAIEVLYGVVRNGVPKPSEALDLTVQALPDSALEAPRILQATDDGSLDVSALTGDADLKVKPWPFIAAGQLISLRFEGTKADGTVYNWSHPTWQNLPISSTGEPSTTVALSSLKELKDGSTLTLVFEVSFDGGLTRVLFPKRVLSVSHHRASGFEDFETAPLGQVPSWPQALVLPSGIIVSSYGLPAPQHMPAAIARAGSPQGEHGFQYLYLTRRGDKLTNALTELPDGKFRTVTLNLWAVTYSGPVVVAIAFYSRGGATIGYRSVEIPRVGRVLVDFTAPDGQYVYRVQFVVGVANAADIACDSIGWSE